MSRHARSLQKLSLVVVQAKEPEAVPEVWTPALMMLTTTLGGVGADSESPGSLPRCVRAAAACAGVVALPPVATIDDPLSSGRFSPTSGSQPSLRAPGTERSRFPTSGSGRSRR